MDPTIVVLLYASVAAAMGAVGAIPVLLRERFPVVAIGWSNALAAGLMLGVAYALTVVGAAPLAVTTLLGGLIGMAFVYWTHAWSGTADLDLNRLGETSPDYGYKVLLVNTLHSAAEGVAIGVAMSVSLSFGVFMTLAIAVHNIPEGTVLSAILAAGGGRRADVAGLAIVANVSQILLAIVSFALVSAAPGLLPWALGFAIGAMIYLVMVELLPECYRQAGSTSIALVTIVAMGIVVLLTGAGRP